MNDKTTVQQTSKPIKLAGAAAKLGVIASCVLTIFGADAWRALGIGCALLFLLAVIFVRWWRWWQHG